jgi:sugar phosphate isomerase/epimerase
MSPISFLARRRFLALSAAAAAGATWFDAPALLAGKGLLRADELVGGFPLGAQSYSLRNFDTLECVRHIQGLGLHFAEFYGKHLPVDATDEQLAATKKLLADAGIKLSGHGVHGFSKNHDANRKLFDFAKRAEVKTITADPTPDSFDSLDKLVEEYGIRIAIHNHGPGHRYDKIESVVKAVKDHHKLIGACVDCGHFLRSDEDPVKAIRELGPRVYGMHLKDDVAKGKASKNVVIGSGELDVVGVFKALREIKFPADGCLSLEYEAKPENPIEDMRACIAVAKEAIAKSA